MTNMAKVEFERVGQRWCTNPDHPRLVSGVCAADNERAGSSSLSFPCAQHELAVQLLVAARSGWAAAMVLVAMHSL